MGIVWKKGTLNIPEAKIQGFKNLAHPTTPKKVKSFICAMAYYRKFIPRYAQLGKGDELPIILGCKRQQWVRKDLGTRKKKYL